MTLSRPALFLALLAVSGTVAYHFAGDHEGDPEPDERQSDLTSTPSPIRPAPNGPTAIPRSDRPLLLDEPPMQKADPTHHEVTVADLSLRDLGEKIERESRTRLQELTDRYQLSANQRRETFPLLVSHHPDYTEGLIVNGFHTESPGDLDFASRFSAILNLNQQELFQEDLGADQAWWRDVLAQIREDLEGTRRTTDPLIDDNGNPVERPDLNSIFGD